MPGRFGPIDTYPVGLDKSNYSCTWFLLASEGKLVQIYITEMDIGKRNGCHSDYVEVGSLLTPNTRWGITRHFERIFEQNM